MARHAYGAAICEHLQNYNKQETHQHFAFLSMDQPTAILALKPFEKGWEPRTFSTTERASSGSVESK